MGQQFGMEVVELGFDLISIEDLTPITQSLITPELALAFGIAPDQCRSMIDLNVASHATYSTKFPNENFDPDCGNLKRVDSNGLEYSNSGSKEENGDDTGLSRAVKRPRLVWTPQLHKRFVDVIEHLGIDKAVPKTIMEMMNVDGLSRENVASHLQKYRLYLKRMDGLSGGLYLGPRRAPSLFECERFSPVPMHKHQQLQHGSALPLMPMPMAGPATGPFGFVPEHMDSQVGNSAPLGYCGLEFEAFNLFWNRHRG